MSFHGFPVENCKYNDVEYTIEQLNVGWAYAVPSLFVGLRKSNNREHAIEHAQDDIRSGGDAHSWRHSEANHGSGEHIFMLRQEIDELKSKLNAKN